MTRLLTRILRPIVAPLIREAILEHEKRLLDIEEARMEKRMRALAERQDTILENVVDVCNESIGSKAGLGFEGPGNAGPLARL